MLHLLCLVSFNFGSFCLALCIGFNFDLFVTGVPEEAKKDVVRWLILLTGLGWGIGWVAGVVFFVVRQIHAAMVMNKCEPP